MATETPSPQSMVPLTPIVFHMLIALADGEKHGYAIMKAVEEDTEGQMSIPIGTLYGSIKRMIEANLIEESDERPAPELDDERRRYYRLTSFGQKVLAVEVSRLARAIAVAQRRQQSEGAGQEGISHAYS